MATIVQEYVRGILARRAITGENPFAAAVQLIRRNGQRYGGYIVHLGIVLIGVAIIGNEFYLSTTNVTLAEGEQVSIAGYTFIYNGLNAEKQPNLTEFAAYLSVVETDSGKVRGHGRAAAQHLRQDAGHAHQRSRADHAPDGRSLRGAQRLGSGDRDLQHLRQPADRVDVDRRRRAGVGHVDRHVARAQTA